MDEWNYIYLLHFLIKFLTFLKCMHIPFNLFVMVWNEIWGTGSHGNN